MILILMEGAERTWVDVALGAHGVELKPSGSAVWVLSEFATERQPQLIRAVFGCRTIMDMVAFSVLLVSLSMSPQEPDSRCKPTFAYTSRAWI
jgi:hypothetical protein